MHRLRSLIQGPRPTLSYSLSQMPAHHNSGRAMKMRRIAPLLMTLALGVAACAPGAGSSSTVDAASLTACQVTADDLGASGGANTTIPTPTPQPSLSGQTLPIGGSTALLPLFAAAAPLFDAANGTTTSVAAVGSVTGLQLVENGGVQIGLSDIYPQDNATTKSYQDLVDHQVAGVAFTLIVSKDLRETVRNLTTTQVRAIFSGQVTTWRDLGGPNEGITVVERPSSSGTRATFERFVLGGPQPSSAPNALVTTSDTTAALVSAVSSAPGSIGYAATGFVLDSQFRNSIFPVCLDGYAATLENINSGSYRFWNYEHAYTKGTPSAASQAMLDYVQSTTFQSNVLLAKGFFRLDQLSDAAKAAHPQPAGA